MDAVNLQAVEKYIEEIESKPSLLGYTSLSFFRDYMTSLGCELPISAHKRGKRTMREVVDIERTDQDAAEAEVPPPEVQAKDCGGELPTPSYNRGKHTMGRKAVVDLESDEDATEVKSDQENNEDVTDQAIKAPPPQKRKDSASQAGKSMAFQEARSKAMTAIRERNFEEAVKHFSLAISIDPTSSLMYCARANVHNKLGNPEASIDDATVALQINPSSTRGRESLKVAYEMLGLPDPEEDELLPSATAEKRKKKMKI